MCGIRCCILDQRSDAINQVDWDLDEVHKIPQWLERRGPDEQQSILLPIISNEEETSNDHNPTSDQKWLLLQASVLCLRPTLIAQPVAISKSSIASRKAGNRHTDDSEQDQDTPLAYFCWNGEIYPNELDIDSPKDRSTAHVSEQGESDTHWMAQKIQTLLLKDTESSDDDLTKHLADTLLSSHDLQHAEFAFVLVMPHRQSIFYGRDGLGRRSLVLQSTTTATADAASNGSTNHSSPENTARTTAAHISWQVSSVVDTDFASASDDCYQVEEVPPSTIFHCNYHTGQSNSYTWKAQPSQLQFTEMPSLTSLGLSSALLDSSQEQQHYCRQLHHLLQNAVTRRLVWNVATGERHSKCAVLFSGGLDSVVLAFFALKLCPNVELVNVSFVLKHEGPQEHESNNTPHDPPINSPVIPMEPTLGKKVKQKKKAMKKRDGSSGSPTATIAADTKAAYDSLEDLKRLFPDRKNLELIHRKVSWEEIEAVQKDRIPHLLYPKRQEQKSSGKDQSNNSNQHAMDLNIATALWFAADTTSKDTRILLTGLGADEWLAGYGRHRQAYLKGGHQELRQELQKDQERLWERNLGRDDRTLSDFGKEVRYPYLDAHVTEYLGSHVPLEHICHFDDNSSGPESLPGDKRLLRLLAQDIGLVSASKAVKRAIQFGSRISHVVDKQRFGSRRKANKSMQKKKE